MIDLFASFIAGVWDYRTKTIPNILTIPLIIYGLYTGINLHVIAVAVPLCMFMDYFEIWHEGDVKLIVGLSLVAPERFFVFLVGLWISTIPITIYCHYKKIERYAYAPFIFAGVVFSYCYHLV